MSNNTLTQLNLSVVKELNDEVAATCSGGGITRGGNDPDVILYDDLNFTGRSLSFNASVRYGDPNIGLTNGKENGFNDITSSIRVIRGTWTFFEDDRFNRDFYVNYEGPTPNDVTLGPGYWNLGANSNKITSLARAA